MSLSKTMRAWQYGAVERGLEDSMRLNASAPVPSPRPNQHLIKIDSVSLNPVDYKPAESWFFRRFVIPNPATPGVDFSGTIVRPAQGTTLKPGDKVFGCAPSPFGRGMLSEYAVANADGTALLPQGLSMTDASTIGVASLTALQTIEPHVAKGARVFLNGGSGGVGIAGVQIAKILGCHVTVTCSGRNAELCQSVGADKIIDYTKGDIVQALVAEQKYDHVVDNVGGNWDIYYQSGQYAKPNAKVICVSGEPSLSFAYNTSKIRFQPAFLGGSRNKMMGFFAKTKEGDLQRIGQWMAEGKMKAVIDSEFAFEDAPKAMAKLKTHRSRGKIVIHVSNNEQ